jgi:acetyl/propionyl-CoA carboxylase alpha subunit
MQLYYDSLLGKLITWGETRERAVRRMRRALDELVIVGVPTSQPFHRRVMDEPTFLSGAYDIGYLEHVGNDLLAPEMSDEELAQIAVAAALAEDEARGAMVPVAEAEGDGRGESPWLRVARLRGLR